MDSDNSSPEIELSEDEEIIDLTDVVDAPIDPEEEIVELTDVVEAPAEPEEAIIELIDRVDETDAADDGVIDLTDVADDPSTESIEPIAVIDDKEAAIELTDVVEEFIDPTPPAFSLDSAETPEAEIADSEPPDESPGPAVSSEEVNAVIERVVREMLSEKIESILTHVIEKEVSKEIQRIRGLLLDDKDEE